MTTALPAATTSKAGSIPKPGPAPSAYQVVSIEMLMPSPTNPRKNFDQVALTELARSIRDHGIVEPIVVRQAKEKFEIVAGERRYRAARIADLAELPVIIRDLTDEQVLEIQIIENLQREDLHPLEEAYGYRRLLATKKYTVESIAERIARSVKYVYDRVKLLDLTPQLQQLFRDGEITAGHAILLARLSVADQKRALGTDADSPLFDHERTLHLPYSRDDIKVPEKQREAQEDTRKPISVRELQSWIDKHVKLEASQVDPMLFPETVATLQTATDEREKVVRITYDEMTPEAVQSGPRPILGRSWKRADGKMGSKTCDASVIGQVVIGHSRGEAFRVCTAKKSCPVHWPKQVKAAKKQKKVATQAAARGEDPGQARRLEQAREQKLEQYRTLRWERAQPAITAALADVIKRAPAGAAHPLGKLVLRFVADEFYSLSKAAAKLIPPGKTAEDLLRHIGLGIVMLDAEYGNDEQLAERSKAFGVDVEKLLEQALPPLARCRECGCMEEVACVGGCSWIEKPDAKGRGLCSSPKCAEKAKKAKGKR